MLLTIDEIKSQFPEQWVLIGNPELNDRTTLGSIVSKLVSGVVLLASKDKREIAYKAKELKEGYSTTACIFTGEIPQNRIMILLKRAQDLAKEVKNGLEVTNTGAESIILGA